MSQAGLKAMDESKRALLDDPRVRWGLVVLSLGLLAGVSFLRRDRAPAQVSTRAAVSAHIRRDPAGPEVRAILAPLAEGSEVVGWRITDIEGVRDGCIHLVLHKGNDDIEVIIELRQGTSVSAPVTVGAYALFNMGLDHLDRDAMRVMNALAQTLRARASVPQPPGMGPFIPSGRR